MVILKEQGTSQSFKIIPRVNDADSIIITGIEGSNTVAFTPTYDLYYMVIAMNETNIVYKGRIFCTNQAIGDFSINTNIYTETVSNNDFIIV